jgi:hypothetical protein
VANSNEHTVSKRTLSPALSWGAIAVAAIGLGVYAKASSFDIPSGHGRSFPRVPGPAPDLPTLLARIGVGSVVWYAAAIALPFLLWGARRFDTERDGRARTIIASSAVVTTLFLATAIMDFLVTYAGAPETPSPISYAPVALRQDLLPWIALAGIVAAIEARRRAVRATIERERLRAQVAEQRLIALTGQLQPHFLFNTLQGISTLIHRDADAADEMLGKLSDLLRDLLRHRERVLIPLGDEIKYTRTYLEIAELRFADRLSFEIDVHSTLHSALVPLFMLQPLVENALTYGIGTRAAGGRVVVKAWHVSGTLHIEVSDNGGGLAHGSPPRDGIGLSNTRERLRASFGDECHLSIEPGASAGVVATVTLPFRADDPVAVRT